LNRVGKRGLMKILLLSTILKYGRVHGYKIYKELVESSSMKWNPSIGTIYRILNNMTNEGYVEKEIENIGNRRIVYYKATDKGLEEFMKIASCVFNKIITGLEVIVPTIKMLKVNNRLNNEFDSEMSIIRDIVNEYFSS